ncbi:hypothetical protein [Clostridium sp. JNZ J1-5]
MKNVYTIHEVNDNVPFKNILNRGYFCGCGIKQKTRNEYFI